MSVAVLEVIDPGLGLSLQDRGRPGWRRYGVPPGGAMDDHAADCANRLLANPPDAPVLELLMQGACLRVVHPVWVALAGAPAGASIPLWKTLRLEPGQLIDFPRQHQGVWTYIAVEGGFVAELFLGSASALARAGIGRTLTSGSVLHRRCVHDFNLPPGVGARRAVPAAIRDHEAPPSLKVWPGPQWAQLGEILQRAFFATPWTVHSRSDRTGYRLQGVPLSHDLPELHSEPVEVGTIQIPPGGQPIVTLRDGPTVGGYPKLGVVDPADLSWLVQCRPGQRVRFTPVQP